MTNQLITDANYMTYTKAELIDILEAKAKIYMDYKYVVCYLTLQEVLPTGYKRLTKAEIIDEIQYYNYYLGINKPKSEAKPMMKWGVMHLDANGNLDYGNCFHEFTAHNPIKFFKSSVFRSRQNTGFAFKAYPYNDSKPWYRVSTAFPSQYI